jgi:hypothetical protein
MKIKVVRRWFGENKTISKVYINGIFRYYALEDLVRPDGVKVAKETAIPYGTYPVTVSHSPKIGRRLPLINDVPMFSGIRIHAGVDEKWTEGCLLISRRLENGKLALDRDAEKDITAMIDNAIDKGNPVTLKVTNYQRRATITFVIIIVLMLLAFAVFKFIF